MALNQKQPPTFFTPKKQDLKPYVMIYNGLHQQGVNAFENLELILGNTLKIYNMSQIKGIHHHHHHHMCHYPFAK